jgi:hypothetical protein
MHKKGLCANKWTEIDLNQRFKTIFFPKSQKILFKNPEKCSYKATTSKPINGHFLPIKHVFFISTSHNIIYKHI